MTFKLEANLLTLQNKRATDPQCHPCQEGKNNATHELGVLTLAVSPLDVISSLTPVTQQRGSHPQLLSILGTIEKQLDILIRTGVS